MKYGIALKQHCLREIIEIRDKRIDLLKKRLKQIVEKNCKKTKHLQETKKMKKDSKWVCRLERKVQELKRQPC